MSRIYKILPRTEWTAAQADGVFTGSAVDLADGYIHFSTGPQAAETARRHFAGQADLGESLVWEPSRGGDLFPHLYGHLAVAAVRTVTPAPLGDDGVPSLGELA